MGTNYYVAENLCDHCGRTDAPYHIGKSGTIVQAYRKLYDEDMPTPWGEITSWRDWKNVIQVPGVQITNEYSEVLTSDELTEIFERTTPEQRRRQYDVVLENWPDCADQYTLDEDGFSVCDGEFS